MLKVTYLPQNMFNNICSLMSHFHQEIPALKKVLTIFVLEEQTSNLDQGMGVLVCGLQAARIAL